jgi:hypothetical protein
MTNRPIERKNKFGAVAKLRLTEFALALVSSRGPHIIHND